MDNIKDLGERIGKLETGQALILRGQDLLTTQGEAVLAELKTQNGRLDDHEVRIDRRETAYEERVKPAMDQVRNVELKIAGSAVTGTAVGGAILYAASLLLKGGA